MPAALVDSNVLPDLLTEDSDSSNWSARQLAQVANTARIIINSIIFAEISIRFRRIENLEAALPDILEKGPLPFAAAVLIGKVFLDHRRQAGTKTTLLPVFSTGAHAPIRQLLPPG